VIYMGRGLSKLQQFILAEARGHIIVTAGEIFGSEFSTVDTGCEISGREMRLRFFHKDSPAARAAFSRALVRLVQRGLLCRGSQMGNWHRYALPGTPLTAEKGLNESWTGKAKG
jgi:hypothetical protein